MEDSLIRKLVQSFPQGRDVLVGVGDDCAVVRYPHAEKLLLLKTDCVIEGIHFKKDTPAIWVGWKALCRAISDVAACGGVPAHALVTFATPDRLSIRWLQSIYRGIGRAARRFGVSVIGGESSRSLDTLFLSITLTGYVSVQRLTLRSGAQPGDSLFVTGQLGGSLQRGHHLKFIPRLAEARWLTTHFSIHAMTDLSDGIGSDLPRMAAASQTGFEINLQLLPRNPGCSIRQALSEGEDYELLFAIPPGEEKRLLRQWDPIFPSTRLTRIGHMKTCSESEKSTPLPTGYDHFLKQHI
ncbi:Thiamine-monophosphate kinase [Candidatus Xiphinematobacter sp. Idaho Grape]|uniref:thiamine-phosphate kinase n=1 Tax=Candidatus Xiphinematobacter sp. Idaho Grape TaxID=1704307 RepID=UPI000706BDF7|nr:thiamine-phosphate kinase [Candidatus Xiphinematobacter sp. Idaho Grape]ALJ56740.1 Thiamine-monophosphate kinase [Candidatus Xiphinematobacter sp. Idaho Grape]